MQIDIGVTLAVVCLAAAGCEQASQELLGVDATGTVSRVIGPTGGMISTPAGLSLDFPSGSLVESTEVTIAPWADRLDLSVPVDGEIVSGTEFGVEPAGLGLEAPARLSLRVPREALDAVDPLALTGVLFTGGDPIYLSHASVDLRQGILRTTVPSLGAVAVRVSDDVVTVGTSGVFASRSGSAGGGGAALRRAADTRRTAADVRTADFAMGCGASGEPTCSTTDAIAVTLSEELYDALNGCVEFIDPIVAAELTIEEAEDGATRATGSIAVSGTVRYQTGSDGTACSSGDGSVHSLAVDDVFTLGSSSAEGWTTFSYDAGTGTITFAATSDGRQTFDCDCGSDIFAADQIWIGQASEQLEFEGLSGQVTWSIRLDR